MRIVSFLPSATELIYELGDQELLYGVTHECKYPPDAKSKLQIIDSVINSDKLTSKEIDTKTCQLLKDGKDIFVLNEKNLKDANPDLIISQETCEVCAAYTNQVKKAMNIFAAVGKTITFLVQYSLTLTSLGNNYFVPDTSKLTQPN